MLGESLFGEVIRWMCRGPQFVVYLAVICFLTSTIGVVYSSHMTRQLYGSLQLLQKAQDDFDNEYEKLLLEQSAFADYVRVDRIANEDLGMIVPGVRSRVIIYGELK